MVIEEQPAIEFLVCKFALNFFKFHDSVTLIIAEMTPEELLELHTTMLANHERRLEEHERWKAEMEEAHKKHERDTDQIRQILRHAVRLAVREARNERRKRRELDDKIAQLAAAQLVTEEKLKEVPEIEERRFGGNGQH